MKIMSGVLFALLSIIPSLTHADETSRKIYITDQTGERWDITTAVESFAMNPKQFHYGLGKNHFKPVMFPAHMDKKPSGADDNIFAAHFEGFIRGYSKSSLRRHETIIDDFGEKKVFIAYCMLCGLAGVYDRVVDGKALTLVASGWTYQQNQYEAFVLYDRETGTLWYPFDGDGFFTAVQGPLVKKELKPFTSAESTTFTELKSEYPAATYSY